jgi:CRISPR-associated protein Csy1
MQMGGLLGLESAVDRFGSLKEVRALLRMLADLLLSDPGKTLETRSRRVAIEQALGAQLPVFAATVYSRLEPGWTRDPECRLPLCEQLWLDPGRVELPPREGYEEEDADFEAAYHRGDWPEEIATRFANWLNARLRSAGLTTVGDVEFKHWSIQAIVESHWSAPLRRRALKGDAQ